MLDLDFSVASTVCATLLTRPSTAGAELAKKAVGAAKALKKAAIEVPVMSELCPDSRNFKCASGRIRVHAAGRMQSRVRSRCVAADPSASAASSDTSGGACAL